MKFCETCGNLLVSFIDNGHLKFQCASCTGQFESTDADTLIARHIKETKDNLSIEFYIKLLNNAPYVPCIPRETKYCETCKKDRIVSFVRLGDNFSRVFICGECNSYWHGK
jgi:DNA-directed RNA polymerase subunit M/transcription elongation factor TFIIS